MWRNPAEVYTHEGKKFDEHVEEIIKLGNSFLTFYQMPAKCFDWLRFIAEYHDIGKTHKDWELREREKTKKRIPHSLYSVEYFFDPNNEQKLQKLQKLFGKFSKEEAWLLLYLIAKHHQSFTDHASDDSTRMVIRQVRNLLEKEYSWTSLIQLVDTFGLFKLADVCSAGNKLDFRLSKPLVDESVVRKIIGHRIDEKRFAQQKVVLTNCPDIAILRAYTGWGKTDVSMLFFEQKSVSRIFYMFPTITAINKFWNKLEEAVSGNVSRFFHLYLAEIKDEDELIENFFYIRNFASFPYIITTVDQFLLTFLQVGRYYLRRPMFRNSGIVVDEVHLLTPLMLHLLIWFLKKFRELYQLRVLFMSATLPRGLSSYLLSELGLQKNSLLDFSQQYENKRRIMWQRENKRIDEVLEKILEASGGRRVLVVANTVEKAIQLAHKLEQIKKYEEDFNVIHARFVYEDRRKKEEWIHQRNQQNLPHVLVSTQVCEVSLDVNYDVLVTELASIPALIQRFGRVNRYGEKTEEINVYVTEPDCNVERYPYTSQELKEAGKMIDELEGEALKSEKMMLDFLDQVTEDSLRGTIEAESKNFDLEAWEEAFHYLFSFKISDEKMRKLVNYREGLTVEAIPHPDCVQNSELRDKIRSLINRIRDTQNRSFQEKLREMGNLLSVSVPVPVWWFKEAEEIWGFPVIGEEGKIYGKYGFERL